MHLEDSPIDAALIAEHLARSGLSCDIHLVASRDDYAAALAAGGFDAIIADYVVPAFDGLAALDMARDGAPGIPFIFVSGTLGEEAAVDAVRRGATDYVVKQRLARLAIVLRRAMAEALAGQRAAQASLRESEARLRLALDAGRLGAWELDLRSDRLNASPTCRADFGQPPDTPLTEADLRAAVHPEDRERMQATMARAIAQGEDCDDEYRVVRPSGEVRWVQLRSRPSYAPDGTALGMAGVSLDVTERKLAEERLVLLMREVNHRAKNALAVVQSVLRLTRTADLPGYVRAVEGRVAALARVQTLLAEDAWTGADLRVLLEGELAPFLGDGRRAVMAGPAVVLPARVTQPLTMAMHELATNAVKYGALSEAAGCVTVTWSVEKAQDDTAQLRLRWAETGGPAVPGRPTRRGFGGRVLDGTVRMQLGGTVSLTWAPSGLVCDLDLPLAGWAGDEPAMRPV
nr:HWE histidine kinase domain-containing protein [Roseicella sp. DB1501]